MYRTHSILFKFYLPLALILGLVLTLWQAQVLWYLFVFIFPLVLIMVIVSIGKFWLTRERRKITAGEPSNVPPTSPTPNHHPAAPTFRQTE